ncbi:MAG: acyl-CoA thioesterase [Thermaceae bacterium]|nr:acyl-CoA thioesterase [Thermaceae bacterium]
MPKSDFKFFHRLRVRWAEADLQGIVFNGHYLTYADVAITEYWRAIGCPYPSSVQRLGADWLVVKAILEYRAPARYDDELDIGVRVGRIGNSSLQFVLEMFCGENHLIDGEIIYVTVNPQTHKPLRVPDVLREAIGGLEGQSIGTE